MMTPESGYTTVQQRNSLDKSSTVGYAPTALPPTHAPTSTSGAQNMTTVGVELKYLDSELGSLFGFIDGLEQKLEAVLTPPGPDSDGSGQLPPFASPLVLKVKDQTTLLATANRRLSILLSRIEL